MPDTVSDKELKDLTVWHAKMARIVAPAKPRTIYLMQQTPTGILQFLGPLPLVKQLTLLSIFFLILTVALALLPQINSTTINQGIFESSGMVLLVNLVFLLTCAGLGATFACLHKIFGYINASTFDPKFNATYWIKIMMGLISGLMMAELIPMDGFGTGTQSHVNDLDKPLIALLGGFSSDLPYRILSRLLEVVEQLFGKNLSKPPQANDLSSIMDTAYTASASGNNDKPKSDPSLENKPSTPNKQALLNRQLSNNDHSSGG